MHGEKQVIWDTLPFRDDALWHNMNQPAVDSYRFEEEIVPQLKTCVIFSRRRLGVDGNFLVPIEIANDNVERFIYYG